MVACILMQGSSSSFASPPLCIHFQPSVFLSLHEPTVILPDAVSALGLLALGLLFAMPRRLAVLLATCRYAAHLWKESFLEHKLCARAAPLACALESSVTS